MDTTILTQVFLLAGLTYFIVMILVGVSFIWFLYATWKKIERWEWHARYGAANVLRSVVQWSPLMKGVGTVSTLAALFRRWRR